ncbi:hypothetical protein FHS72_000145 [Loktanella ponticola]|uniref:Uncharacterized protein n=1 Tax=Yoonia ponticola TaxID=1524255 RepID=A0A7W9BHQ4_9RHOB|nr:hypothetical protein [Yoonia ponticola]MBB5720541.1 hypothetical protein [Yoonia ponticola]
MYERAPKSHWYVSVLNDAPRGTTARDCDVAGIFELGLTCDAPFAFCERAVEGFADFTADFLGFGLAGVKVDPHALVSAVTVALRIFCRDRARAFLNGSYM